MLTGFLSDLRVTLTGMVPEGVRRTDELVLADRDAHEKLMKLGQSLAALSVSDNFPVTAPSSPPSSPPSPAEFCVCCTFGHMLTAPDKFPRPLVFPLDQPTGTHDAGPFSTTPEKGVCRVDRRVHNAYYPRLRVVLHTVAETGAWRCEAAHRDDNDEITGYANSNTPAENTIVYAHVDSAFLRNVGATLFNDDTHEADALLTGAPRIADAIARYFCPSAGEPCVDGAESWRIVPSYVYDMYTRLHTNAAPRVSDGADFELLQALDSYITATAKNIQEAPRDASDAARVEMRIFVKHLGMSLRIAEFFLADKLDADA